MHINHRRKNRHRSYLSWRGVKTYRWFKKYRSRLNRRHARHRLRAGREAPIVHPNIRHMLWRWIF